MSGSSFFLSRSTYLDICSLQWSTRRNAATSAAAAALAAATSAAAAALAAAVATSPGLRAGDALQHRRRGSQFNP